MSRTYQILIKVLCENFGLFIFDDVQDDFSINDYVTDSLSFIQFIIAMEEELHIELPDDFLDFEILNSARGFIEKIDSYIESL